MSKKVLQVFVMILLTSCSAVKPLALSNRPADLATASERKRDLKFLDIASTDNGDAGKSTVKGEHTSGPNIVASTESNSSNVKPSVTGKSSGIQLKYSQLLNTNADQVQNILLYQTIDEWYGTRYHLGGTTKSGIDCSAFVQTIFAAVFGVNLPRVARDQYKATRHISRTELQEGDLLFFNTLGGVSHVGIYLQNNKFVHASVSGVMISDMFEPYYVRHFVAAGRVKGMSNNFSASLNP